MYFVCVQGFDGFFWSFCFQYKVGCLYVCMLSRAFWGFLFVLFSTSFLSLWFGLFKPTENKLYDKADTSTVKMTSL